MELPDKAICIHCGKLCRWVTYNPVQCKDCLDKRWDKYHERN